MPLLFFQRSKLAAFALQKNAFRREDSLRDAKRLFVGFQIPQRNGVLAVETNRDFGHQVFAILVRIASGDCVNPHQNFHFVAHVVGDFQQGIDGLRSVDNPRIFDRHLRRAVLRHGLIIVADDRNAVVHKPKMAGEIAARGFCDVAADFSLTQKRPHIHKQRKFAVGILVKIDQIDACGDADDSANIADIRMDDALWVSPAAKQQQRRLSPVSAARRRAQPRQIDRGEMLERQKIFPRLPEIFT